LFPSIEEALPTDRLKEPFLNRHKVSGMSGRTRFLLVSICVCVVFLVAFVKLIAPSAFPHLLTVARKWQNWSSACLMGLIGCLLLVLAARQRVLLVYSLAAIILGGSLYTLLMDAEYWPFLSYRLVAVAEESHSLTSFVLFGVPTTTPDREFPLTQFKYTQPLDNSRLRVAFASIYENRRDRLRDAVRDCLVRYDALRQAGKHHGPALRAMRLYRAYWVLNPRGRNVDHPDRKDLLVEIQRSEIQEH
jgi:hypothetical protein